MGSTLEGKNLLLFFIITIIDIGVGRFRILGGGGARFRILGGGGGGQFPSRHMVSFRRDVPSRYVINQCQIITFLILKSDIIKNSRIKLKGMVLPVPSNQIKVTFLLFYPSTWYICDFFLLDIKIEEKCSWIIGVGGRGQRVCCRPPPPLSHRHRRQNHHQNHHLYSNFSAYN